MQADLNVDDNNKINVGSGDDLQVYHNGTDTHIDNTNGDLYISTQDGGDVVIQGSGTQTPMATFTEGGGVTINHNGSAAIETTATGVDVTGNLTTTGTVNGYDLSAQMLLFRRIQTRLQARDFLLTTKNYRMLVVI